MHTPKFSLGKALLIKGNSNCVHYMMIVGEGREAVGTCKFCKRTIAYGMIENSKFGRRLQFARTELLDYDITMQKYGLGS